MYSEKVGHLFLFTVMLLMSKNAESECFRFKLKIIRINKLLRFRDPIIFY